LHEDTTEGLAGQLAKLPTLAEDLPALLNVAAVGITLQAWRNSPLEDAHASSRGP
jgi:hypothetical protein